VDAMVRHPVVVAEANFSTILVLLKIRTKCADALLELLYCAGAHREVTATRYCFSRRKQHALAARGAPSSYRLQLFELAAEETDHRSTLCRVVLSCKTLLAMSLRQGSLTKILFVTCCRGCLRQ